MKFRPSVRSRHKKRRAWKVIRRSFPVLGISVLSLSSLVAFLDVEIFKYRPDELSSLNLSNAWTNRASLSGSAMPMDSSTASEVMRSAKKIELEALERTALLMDRGWNEGAEQEWFQVEAMWQSAAETLADVAVPELTANPLEASVLESLKTLYHDYHNRQDLTLALRDYQESVFLAEQLDPSDTTVCDVQTRLSDSPDKWEMVVALRQQSVDHLRAVARNVSFYEAQVVPLQVNYQQGLETATRMQQRGPWYYAIQKAVCATEWGERAKASGDKEDWMQSVAFWKEGIALLESAPEVIPAQIPNEYRESYQTAKGNLGLWKENLRDAEIRAGGAGFGSAQSASSTEGL